MCMAAVYSGRMRRIQIHIDEDLDDFLAAKAIERGTSKAALIREAVRRTFRPPPPHKDDPIDALVGSFDIEPDYDIDEVVYEWGR